jgi:hypothetical protein
MLTQQLATPSHVCFGCRGIALEQLGRVVDAKEALQLAGIQLLTPFHHVPLTYVALQGHCS